MKEDIPIRRLFAEIFPCPNHHKNEDFNFEELPMIHVTVTNRSRVGSPIYKIAWLWGKDSSLKNIPGGY